MPDYRRQRVRGGCYFFTVNLQDRHSDLLVTEIAILRTSVRATRVKHPFHIDAWVVLPDHMHCLWTLPNGDNDFSVRWQMIKAIFSRCVPHAAGRRESLIRKRKAGIRKREAGIWQRRFWEHAIRDDRDFAAQMNYVHFNPVKHGYVAGAGDWAFSSFGRCVALGLYPEGWAMDGAGLVEPGEREALPAVG